MSDNLSVIEQHGKFFVVESSSLTQAPKISTNTKFDSKQDAERYISILKRLPPILREVNYTHEY